MEHQKKSPAGLTCELEAMKQRFSRLESERQHLTNMLRYAEYEKRMNTASIPDATELLSSSPAGHGLISSARTSTTYGPKKLTEIGR